jgi:hypothetical protein
MAITTAAGGTVVRSIERHVESGTANTQLVVTVTGKACRLLAVNCHYSGAVTQAGVTTAVDSGAGANFDFTYNTGSANAQDTSYIPSVAPVFMADDAIIVTAPAGGAGDIAHVTIYTEPL